MTELEWWCVYCGFAALAIILGMLATPLVGGWLDRTIPLDRATGERAEARRNREAMDRADLRGKARSARSQP